MLTTIAIAAVSFVCGALAALVYSGWREQSLAYLRDRLKIAEDERAGAEKLHADLTDKHNALLARIDKAFALEPPVGGNGTARRMAKILRGEA